MKRFFYISLFILLFLTGKAQDIHFSQYNNSPLNLNPALTGNFNNTNRIVLNHRSQWRSITIPYKTFSFSYDRKITNLPVKIKNSYFGIGLLFNTDKAGDGDFGTNQIKIPLSFNKILNSDSSLILSIGENIAFNQNSLNFQAFNFGDQFNGNKFDPNSSTGETPPNANISYFDFSAGINLFHRLNKKIFFNYGFAYNHLNQPKQSFNDVAEVTLDSKINFYVNSSIYLNNNFDILPTIAYFNQGKYHELDFGGLLQYKTHNINVSSVYFGGLLRFKDAIIINMQLDYKDFTFGITYDINISTLKIASNGYGGLELSMIYLFGRTNNIKIPELKQCPVFM